MESGQLDEAMGAIRSKSRDPAGGKTARDHSNSGLGNKAIFNASQKLNKSMDLTGQNFADGGENGPTGLPENDDEILR